ncbi:MAG: TolC family protein [Gemmatimonadales bacterium]
MFLRFRRGLIPFCALLLIARPGDAQVVGRVLTLRSLLDSVATQYPRVRMADAAIRAAQGSRRTAGTFGNPMLGVQVENLPLPGSPSAAFDRETMYMLTLPLEPLYQRGPRVRQADADVRGARADAAASRTRIGADAANAFYRVATAQIGLETMRDLVSWLDTVVAYNRERTREGIAAEADLIRSEIERDRASADAAVQEAELVRARADLLAYLGDPRTGTMGLTVAVDSTPLPLPDLSGAAASRRPDLLAASERLSAAASAVALEGRMTFRQVGATFGLKQAAGMSSLIAGLSLPIPIFDANRGQVQRAAAERDIAAFELTAMERVASAEVLGAAEAARILTTRMQALAGSGANGFLARVDESRRIALGSYREGGIPLFQAIDAARAWGDARFSYYRSLYAQHMSVVMLLAAQGADLLSDLPAPAGVTRP